MKLIQTEEYILFIDEKAEIKEGNIAVHDFGMGYKLEIPCDEDNLKSNTRNLAIAYYPLSEEAKELDLPLLPNPFEEIDVEELSYIESLKDFPLCRESFEKGYKAAQSKQFSLEDVVDFVEWANLHYRELEYTKAIKNVKDTKELFNYYLSLSAQQLPKEFIPEYQKDWKEATKVLMESMGDNPEDFKYEETLKTTTNSEGKEVLVGTYRY